MKKILINTVLFTTCLGAYQSINAACVPNPGFSTVDISMNVGRVVVRPSDPVGKVLHKSSFPIIPNGSTSVCDYYGGFINANITHNYPVSPVGDTVYSTNIPGIGVRLYREAQDASYFSGYYPYRRELEPNTTYTLTTGYFVVEIVKIASQTGSGAFVPGRYSAYSLQGYPGQPLLTSTVYGNAITIASSSCEIQGNPNRTIELTPVTTAEFSGIGSTLAEQAFNMNILCNGGQNPSGYEEKNLISLSYDYVQDGTNNQVLSNIAPANQRASGVAVQLLWNGQNKQVIKNNDQFTLGTVNSNQSLQYQIPMIARYYQNADTVSAGKVRGMATVTIKYD